MVEATTLKGSGIPKRIHQIWIGSNPKPDLWINTVKDFAATNGYVYRLWTESDLEELPWKVEPKLRELYDSFGDEMAGKADLIRLLVLYKYGGMYIDADSVILKPAKFAEFLECNRGRAFFGWEDLGREKFKKLKIEGEDLSCDRRLIANGTIGATKENAFIRELLSRVVSHAAQEKEEKAWKRVGPVFVTRVWKSLEPSEKETEKSDVIIYPMHYFYAKHWHQITDPEMHKKVQIPVESMLFQYGYTTNGFAEIFRKRGMKGGTRRSRAARRQARRKSRAAKRPTRRLSRDKRRRRTSRRSS